MKRRAQLELLKTRHQRRPRRRKDSFPGVLASIVATYVAQDRPASTLSVYLTHLYLNARRGIWFLSSSLLQVYIYSYLPLLLARDLLFMSVADRTLTVLDIN